MQDKNFVTLIDERGFTFVEVLVAAMIMTTSVGALGWSFLGLQKSRVKGELISGVTSIETALTTALLNEDNYPESIRPQLQAGTVPSSLTFPVVGSSMEKPFNFAIKPGETIELDRNGSPCAGATFPASNCPYRIQLAMRQLAGAGALSSSSMAFAYRIETRDPDVQLNFRGAGADSDSGAFTDEEFTITLPYEYYLSKNAGRLLLECPSTTTVGVWGIDRSGGGSVSCIDQPRESCPQGTLPKGLRFVSHSATSASVEFECGPSVQTASCPTDYALLQIDTTTLDAGRTKSGTCVYVGASPAAGHTYRGERIEGRVCPRGYRSQSSCALVDEVSSAGSCPWCHSSTPDCSAASPQTESPVGTYNITIPYRCADSNPLTQAANRGQARLVENLPNKGDVLCYLHRPQQDCGATWDAKVELNVTCVLDTPTTPETRSIE